MLFQYFDQPTLCNFLFFQCLPPAKHMDNLHDNLKTNLAVIVTKAYSLPFQI